MKTIEELKNKIICGDTLEVLKEIPDESIDMVITSPPYWGLRRYGDYKEQIGLEPTFSEYLDKIMVIMKEIKRVVKKEGQIWVNIGDCYASNGPEETRFWHGNNVGKHKLSNDNYAGRARCKNYQSKCLLMVPERFAMRCIDELGLILRNKIKWAKQVLIKKENRTKGSVMPTSVKDRFNESGEELYFFVKSKKYYSDLDAVRLSPQTFENRPDGITRSREYGYDSKYLNNYSPQNKQSNVRFNYRVRDAKRKEGQPQFRASEEEIKKYQGKFAGNPDVEMFESSRARTQRKWKQEEVEGYKMGSVDPHRAALRGGLKRWRGQKEAGLPATYIGPTGEDHNLLNNPLGKNLPTIWLIGSEPHNFKKELDVDVDHFAIFPQALLEIPIKFGCPKDGIVLDPFMGSGTTAIVAKKLGRNFVGIELNPQYIKIAEARIKSISKSLSL